MKSHRRSLVLALASLSCLGRDPLQPPPKPLVLRAIVASTGSLDELSRFADITLRFDRAIAPPSLDAVLLIASAPSDALLSDAAHGDLSATNAARRVACRLTRDARDPAVLHLRAERAQQPDTQLTLIVTPALYADDDGTLATPDAGARVIASAARIAPARRCGAVAAWRVIDADAVPITTGPLYARFDRPVRVARGASLGVKLTRADGLVWPSHASLGCADPDGMFRCVSVEPARPLTADARYGLTLSGLEARNGRAVEAPDEGFTARRLASWQQARFGPSPVCASDETARGSFCVRVVGASFELRALTTRRALLVAAASDGRDERVGIGAVGASHVVRVPAVSPGTVHAITVRALGLDGRADATEVVWPVTSASPAPRVRISEVLAHPRGASTQEFVELVNDEPVAVNVGGWALAQSASRTVFPMGATVPARGRAVVAARSFDPRGSARGDSPVASGSSLIVLPSAIARGLRDSGSDLTWIDPSGVVRSTVPGASSELSPREGVGLVRAETDLADEDPAAWDFDARDESSPGAPDALR